MLEASLLFMALAGYLHEAIAGQWEQLQHFWRTPALRIPIINIWVATFGAALHGPCTTFFLLELGLTTAEIGNGGMLMSLPDLFLAPCVLYIPPAACADGALETGA